MLNEHRLIDDRLLTDDWLSR